MLGAVGRSWQMVRSSCCQLQMMSAEGCCGKGERAGSQTQSTEEGHLPLSTAPYATKILSEPLPPLGKQTPAMALCTRTLRTWMGTMALTSAIEGITVCSC